MKLKIEICYEEQKPISNMDIVILEVPNEMGELLLYRHEDIDAFQKAGEDLNDIIEQTVSLQDDSWYVERIYRIEE